VLMKVVLPAPERPNTAHTHRCGIDTDTSCSTSMPPRRTVTRSNPTARPMLSAFSHSYCTSQRRVPARAPSRHRETLIQATDARQNFLAEELHRLGLRPARQDELAHARAFEVDQGGRNLVRVAHERNRRRAVRPDQAGPQHRRKPLRSLAHLIERLE